MKSTANVTRLETRVTSPKRTGSPASRTATVTVPEATTKTPASNSRRGCPASKGRR
jgi:hypothetical protein